LSQEIVYVTLSQDEDDEDDEVTRHLWTAVWPTRVLGAIL